MAKDKKKLFIPLSYSGKHVADENEKPSEKYVTFFLSIVNKIEIDGDRSD